MAAEAVIIRHVKGVCLEVGLFYQRPDFCKHILKNILGITNYTSANFSSNILSFKKIIVTYLPFVNNLC